MKAIQTQLQINRVTLRKDDSIGFSAVTPELSDVEAMEFRKLSKTLVNVLLEPFDGSDGVLKVEAPIEGKSPSQRLRSVLFVLWKQEGEPEGDFEVYYRIKINNIIEWIKDKLE